TLALPGNFLVSEAVRGEGAVLRDDAGERFMPAVHPDAELAPRDVVARAVAAQMLRTGAPVYLDATALGEDFLRRRFPSIDAAVRAPGWTGLASRCRSPRRRTTGWVGWPPTCGGAPRCPDCWLSVRWPAPGCTARTGWRRTRCSKVRCSGT